MTKAEFEASIHKETLESALPRGAELEIHDEFVNVKLPNGKTVFLESVIESLEACGHEIVKRDPELDKHTEASIARIYPGDGDA